MQAADGGATSDPSHDVTAMVERLAKLESLVATQGEWIARMMRGSIIVVDAGGCGVFTSIQQAIQRCAAGDTIVVRPGTYTEPLVIDKPDLTIRGVGFADTCVETNADACTVVFKATATVIGMRLVQQRKYYGCVRFEDGSGSLENCDITAANLSCIVVGGSAKSPQIRRCTVRDSKQHGIAVKANTSPIIEYNKITGLGQPGIVVEEESDPVIRYNEISDSLQNGIWIKAKGRGVIEYNDIHSNAYSNIDVMEGANPVIRYNRIFNSGKCGVCIAEQGAGSIEDNDIFGNSYSNVGIMAGANPTVVRNLIHNSKQHGVFIKAKAKGTIQDNNIFANTLANIKLEDGAEAIHRNNQNGHLRARQPLEAVGVGPQ
eukprot:TRINITY_DN7582_c0_g1_i1.p1 TRINITY_DN7582_c0_g1~~TRINITY_DN7582_c0_g1_i1.p1  ORF type:complete len:374 (-),score=70.00 TRINITY_DN7582_c0_g1_i1:54-1175(-)